MRPLLAVALLVGFASAAPVPKSVKKADTATLLVGTWKPMNDGTCWFEFRDDGTAATWHVRNGNTQSQMKWKWALDAEASTPRRVKFTRTSSQPNQEYDCALELDGDALKFAFLNNSRELPAKLDKNSGLNIYDLARSADGK